MERLPPIPSPPSHHWREFRINVLPFVVFSTVLIFSVLIWRDHVSPPNLVGQVEGVLANVTAPKAGSVLQLGVTRFQRVNKGDPVAQVMVTEPKVMTASLGVIQAEVQLLRVGMSPLQGQQRMALDYERLRLDGLLVRSQLAIARVQLQETENEFKRQSHFFEQKIISQEEYDRAKSLRDAKLEEVAELTRIVSENQRSIQSTSPSIRDPSTNRMDSLDAAIAVQEEKLKLSEAEMAPVTLLAPISGVVSVINKSAGENVAAAETIVTITASNSDHIIGYLRQPLNMTPKPGMSVQVRSRSALHGSARAQILQVGGQLETINTALLPQTHTKAESGLPILVSLPPELQLFPGEIVDLSIIRDGK